MVTRLAASVFSGKISDQRIQQRKAQSESVNSTGSFVRFSGNAPSVAAPRFRGEESDLPPVIVRSWR